MTKTTKLGLNDAHIPWLDWLRFSAAFLVVLSHLRGHYFTDWSNLDASSRTTSTLIFFSMTRLGDIAVIMFFVLSGYLVGGRLIERLIDGSFELKKYAIDRLSRIYTPLVPAVALTAIAGGLLDIPGAYRQALGSLTSLQGTFFSVPPANGPLWSLTYEVWFYVAALAIPLAYQKRWVWSLLSLALVGVVFAQLQAHYLFIWFFGALAYPMRKAQPPNKAILALLATTLATVGVALSQFGREGALQMDGLSNDLSEIGLVVFALGFAFSLGLVVTLPFPKNGLSAKIYRAGAPLSAFSYTLYLFHFPLLILLGHISKHERERVVNLGAIFEYTVLLIAILIICYLAYLPFEARTSSVRDWFYRIFDRFQ